MASDPDISVVVATTVGATRLADCVDSLVQQTLEAARFEVIIVRYGAVDDCWVLALEASRRRPDMTVRVHRSNATTRASAKNAGFDLARGRRVVFVHDDDRLSPACLAGMVGFPETAGQLVMPLRVRDQGRKPASFRAAAVRNQLSRAGRIVRPSSMFRSISPATGFLFPRDLFGRIRYDDDLVCAEDAVLLSRMLAAGTLLLAVPHASADAVYYYATKDLRRPRLNPSRLLDAVERVLEMPLPEDLERCRPRLLSASIDEVNRYLRIHGDDHTTVIHERRRRHLQDVVDLQRLNKGVARDLAILYVAVPYVDTSANVAARRVLSRERIVDVISCDMSSQREIDASTDRLWAEYVDQRFEVKARPRWIWWPGVAEFCYKGMAQIAASERSKGPYRSVYSRAVHPTSHFLAAWLKLRRPDVVWRAEFSDPSRYSVDGQEIASGGNQDAALMADFAAGLNRRGFEVPANDNLLLWMETLTYALADEIVFTNENQRKLMLDRFPDQSVSDRAARHSIVRHHPQPFPSFYTMVDSTYRLSEDRVNLAYFGVFYSTRGLTELWQALQQLSPHLRSSLVVHVFTSKPEQLQEALVEAGLVDVVRANAYVSYLEYLNLASRSDVLIVNDARTQGIFERNPYLPSKWSDYAGSGSAVWGIVEPGSVLSTQDMDYRSELGDAEGALKVLSDIVESRTGHCRSAHLSKTEPPALSNGGARPVPL